MTVGFSYFPRSHTMLVSCEVKGRWWTFAENGTESLPQMYDPSKFTITGPGLHLASPVTPTVLMTLAGDRPMEKSRPGPCGWLQSPVYTQPPTL